MAEELQPQPQQTAAAPPPAAPMPDEVKQPIGAVAAAIGVPAQKKKGFNFGILLSKLSFIHVSLEERVLFARQLAIGIKAGLSMQDSLKLLHIQTRSKSMKTIISSIIADTQNGMYLADSLEKYKEVFGQLFINIVRVGEQSGTLTENLVYLAEELKKKQQLISRVRGAMIYPAVIMFATVGIVVTLMVAVFPKIIPVFSSLRITLPTSTKILIATTNLVTGYWLWLALGFFALAIAFYVMIKQVWFKEFFDHAITRVPLFKAIVVKVNLVNIARVLGLLLKSGVQIIEAVNITANALDNHYYREELKNAGEMLRRGEFFSVYLSKNQHLFPPIFTNMIQVGENTGNLSENLSYLAGYYEEDVDNFLKNLNSIIEPVLLLTMGLIVGFMALSVITPIYQISSTLTR